MRTLFKIFFLLLMVSFGSSSYAEEIESKQNTSRLDVISNIDGAKIFLNADFIGVSPLTGYRIKPGSYKIYVTQPNEKSWYGQVAADSLIIGEGEEVRKYIELNYKYLINSQPSDAGVYYKDSLLGKTPFVFYTTTTHNLISIKKEGYKDTDIVFDISHPTTYVILETATFDNKALQYLTDDKTSLKLPVYLAGGGAVLFGVNASWLKIKADNYYKEYQATGDPDKLNKVRKYDKLSGISLALCQLSNFLLAYLLLN